jgi:branched-subunit amino acid permease
MLGHTGALTGAAVPGLATGAEVLTALAERLFGQAGLVLLAAIFVLACFNTCVGLIACVGEYFHTLLPRIPYPALTAFFAVASMLIANLGLAEILRLSVPVLNALYPVAIMLIALSFVPGLEQRRRVYPLCIGCTAVQSIAAALPLGALSALANALPLAALGFGWVLPAVAGLLAGVFLSRTRTEE